MLKWDGSNWVPTDSPSNFSVIDLNLGGSPSGDFSAAANTSWQIIPFGFEVVDTNAEFDNTFPNYRFTPNTAGYYMVNAQYTIKATASTAEFGISIYRNGLAYTEESFNHSNSGIITRQISKLIYFNGSSDYVDVRVKIDGGTGRIVNGWAGKTYLDIHRAR